MYLFQKGESIGHYQVLFPHKEGSYAETYRVKAPDGKTRFLKLIRNSRLNRNQIDDEGQIIEVQTAKQLQHHNLCSYIDSGIIIVDGAQCTYIVTEYVSGETLSQRLIRDHNLSVYEIKQIAKSILSALQHIHTQPVPIIHGEVTIQNVLMNLVGGLSDLKLIDFGHARYLNQPPAKIDLRELNAFYLAPERFSGVSQVQSDLYSVGVIIYQLLYDELPWFIDLSRIQTEDKIEIILNEREKELTIPNKEIFELDDQLINSVIKALSYDAADRFQSAEEFIRAIDGELRVPRQSTKRQRLSNENSPTAPPKGKVNIPKGKGFSAIAGMEDLKAQLREEVIEPLHNPEEYRRYGVTIPNGMLLYGPPGCGKTFFAKHFAEEVGFNFMLMTPATLKSRYVNATQENIAKMFQEAEENGPTIIFIDEINELVPNRESDVHEMARSAVNEMLAQMDRTGEKGIFIIGATNYPHMIDPAILRAGRLEKKYFLGVPDHSARMALFKLYLKDRPYDFGIKYEELAELTANYVSADIQLIVNDAARKALKERSNISMAHLKSSIESTPPSLPGKELARYEEIRRKMEDDDDNNPPPPSRPRIGFR